MTIPLPKIIGHRGAPRRARENTIEVFLAAREEGADGVELDVHRSLDGTLVVHHDAGIEDFGVLAEQPFAAIRSRYAWLPTLVEVLDACSGFLVNIEIKNSPNDADFDPAERVAATVVELLHERAHDEVIVSSFNLASIERVHALDPGIPTGYLMAAKPMPLDGLALAAAGGHRAIHPLFAMLGGTALVDVVEQAHALGVAVNTWTVNDPEEIKRLAAAGVDAIITDVPVEARAVLAG